MTASGARWFAIAGWLILIFFGVRSAHALATQEIAKRAVSATVLIVVEDSSGQPLALGSGFLVRDGVIATNLHVVKGAAKGYAKLVGRDAKHDIEGIVAMDSGRDLALIRVALSGPERLVLGDSDSVRIGEPVYVLGNPSGLEGTFSEGIVSGLRESGGDKLLQITAPISPGSSGGPVLNSRGQVIGISVGTFTEGQNLNFAIPVNYLKDLLGEIGPVEPLFQVRPLDEPATDDAQRRVVVSRSGQPRSAHSGVVPSLTPWPRWSIVFFVVLFVGLLFGIAVTAQARFGLFGGWWGSALILMPVDQPGARPMLLRRRWLTVGRDPGVILRIADRHVSSLQAVIRRSGSTFMLENRGTVNPTRVNGQQVAMHVLKAGDEVDFGGRVYRVMLKT